MGLVRSWDGACWPLAGNDGYGSRFLHRLTCLLKKQSRILYLTTDIALISFSFPLPLLLPPFVALSSVSRVQPGSPDTIPRARFECGVRAGLLTGRLGLRVG